MIVVPILAPMMKGNTFSNETFLFTTAGTTNEVVTVLDWTAAVKKIPYKKATKGDLKMCLLTFLKLVDTKDLKTVIERNLIARKTKVTLNISPNKGYFSKLRAQSVNGLVYSTL